MVLIKFVTDFADQAVILPLAALTAIVLATGGWRRAAIAWLAVVAGTLGLMMVLKMVFAACGHYVTENGPISPSGHTAAAAAVYGGLLAMAARVMAPRMFASPMFTSQGMAGQTWLPLVCAVAVACLIGATRLTLGVHTILDVLIGAAVGMAGATAFVGLAGPPPPGLRFAPLVPVVLAVFVIFHGFHLPAEAAIRNVSSHVWPLSECRQ